MEVPRRRESRGPRSPSRIGIARRATQLAVPAVPWPVGFQVSIPSADPVESAQKEALMQELHANPDFMGYLISESAAMQDVSRRLSKLTDLIPTFPPPETKADKIDLSDVPNTSALTQTFALLAAQHSQMCEALQQATKHVTIIQSRLAYIETEKENLRASEKTFSKMQKEYLQIKPNRPADQLLLEDVRYLNEKRGLELQRFRLRAKMEELKLCSTQAANYFLLESISAYSEFLEQAPALLPPKSLFEGTRTVLQKHDEEMAARLNVCDSVQADLEMEIDAASLIRPQTSGIRDLDGVVETEAASSKKQGVLFNPMSNSSPVGVVLANNSLTLKYDKGEEVIPCMLCTVKESRELEKRFVFSVVTPQRTHHLQADSAVEMQKWMNAIQMAIMDGLNDSSGLEPKESPALLALWNIPGNQLCADCDQENPEWCSINLGCLICLACSGVHRSLGVHISKVRSLKLDQCSESTLGFLMALGNTHHNSIWEANLPKAGDRHSNKRREDFIRMKYNERAFVLPSEQSGERQSELGVHALWEKNYVGLLAVIAAGYNINNHIAAHKHQTLLHMAVEANDAVAMQMLLQNDADILATDNRGWIPLSYAASLGNLDAVRLLLERGGSSQIKCADVEGRTPLDLARENPKASSSFAVLQEFGMADEERLRKEKDREIKDGILNPPGAPGPPTIKRDRSALKITWGRGASPSRLSEPGDMRARTSDQGEPLMQGFLLKKSPKGTNRFQERYFELLPATLIYRKKQGGAVAGEIRLPDVEAGRTAEKTGSRPGEFELDVRVSADQSKKYGARRTFTLCSSATSDASLWLPAIMRRVDALKVERSSDSSTGI